MTTRSQGTTALVLAGGVAKGAFEAGAIDVFLEHGLEIRQVVGTSSGALNATWLAAAIRGGQQRQAGPRLLHLWREEAEWMRVFHFTPVDALRGRALSDSQHILELMRAEVPRVMTGAVHPIGLHLVVTAVRGLQRRLCHHKATTFEGKVSFTGVDFDTPDARERIYAAAAASAAFPIVFHPVEVDGLGPCYDGAIVNDTPLRLATEGGADRVVVIAPYPADLGNGQEQGAFDTLLHLVDMLTHERLFRDLQRAERINHTVERLQQLVVGGTLDANQLTEVLRTLDVKPIEIVSVRPPTDLPGNPFAGFASRKLREEYLAAGRQAALAVLPSLLAR